MRTVARRGRTVVRVPGAARVGFDYTAAGRAIDAFESLRTKLSEQGWTRVAPKDETIVNWAGRFREDFDIAWDDLQARFVAGFEIAALGATPIWMAVHAANDRQRRWNEGADDPIPGHALP